MIDPADSPQVPGTSPLSIQAGFSDHTDTYVYFPVHGDLSAVVGHRQTRTTTVAGRGGVPADAAAVAINITAVTPTRDSYLTVWPSGATRPTVSSINYAADTIIGTVWPHHWTRPTVSSIDFPASSVVGNFVIAELGNDAALDLYNHDGQTDVVFDVVGYFVGD